jgi:hypothetical protein
LGFRAATVAEAERGEAVAVEVVDDRPYTVHVKHRAMGDRGDTPAENAGEHDGSPLARYRRLTVGHPPQLADLLFRHPPDPRDATAVGHPERHSPRDPPGAHRQPRKPGSETAAPFQFRWRQAAVELGEVDVRQTAVRLGGKLRRQQDAVAGRGVLQLHAMGAAPSPVVGAQGQQVPAQPFEHPLVGVSGTVGEEV